MTGPAILYLESSALLRAVLGQGGGVSLTLRLEGASAIHTSRLTQLECERAILRLRLVPGMSEREIGRAETRLRELLDRADVREISEQVCTLAGRIAPRHGLRSLDAIHLATWHLTQEIAPELQMITADRRLAAAAGVDPLVD